ncbi:MAG: site-specific integrase [Actinobacteria bacterium]|nr:site-specific integrase [Actinomycetota bacterium]
MCPRACQSYISLPVLGPVLEEFITWSYQRGYSPLTLKNQLRDAKRIDALLKEREVRNLSDLSHGDFETAWNYYRHRHPSTAGTIRQIERFLEETRRLKPVLPPPRTTVDLELDRFLDYLRNVRGLATRTINDYANNLWSFLEYIGYGENTEALTGLTLKEIEEFLCACSKRLSRYSLKNVVAHLRAFLRFQHEQGVVESPLHTMIDTPRVYQLERLPRSLSWKTVEALLSSIDRTNAHGVRDYTMLFLIAAYGLRPCEVVALTLDNIDWRSGSIRIPQRKTGNQLVLPITDSVGDVLVDYLKRGRPDLPFRELFLRVLAPHGTLNRTAVNGAFKLRVRQSGLDIPYRGAYCLRHSYAVHLLRQGTSLKAIGDLLGHRSAESTCVYLRLATEDLRDVALPVPEEAHIDTPLEIPPLGYRVNPRCRNGNPKPSAGSASPLRSFLSGNIEDYLSQRWPGFSGQAIAILKW